MSSILLAPETRVLTKNGNKQIQMLCDTWVKIWNGRNWSEVYVVKASDSCVFSKVIMDSGDSLLCSDKTQIAIKNKVGYFSDVFVCDLRPADLVLPFSRPDFPADRITQVVKEVITTEGVCEAYTLREPKLRKVLVNNILATTN